MCNPAAIPLVISVISAGASAYQQIQNNEAQNAQFEQTNAALTKQQTQVNAAAAQEKFQRSIQGAAERGAIRAANSETNFLGNSTASLFQNSLFNQGTDISTIENNRTNRVDQIQEEKKGASLKTAANTVSNLAIAGRAGLQIAGAYGDYKNATNPANVGKVKTR